MKAAAAPAAPPAARPRSEASQRQLAALLNLTTQQVRNLEDKGIPHRAEGRQKFYPLPDAITWYVDFKVADAIARRGGNGAEKFEDARSRREQARARMAELQVARQEGNLLPREVVDEAYGKLLEVLRAGILNMPGRWASQLLGLKKPREAEAALKRIAAELLEDFAGPVADELEREGEAIPEDCPGRELLAAAGITTLAELEELGDVDELRRVKGIGAATARKIHEWLEGRVAA